MASQDIRNGDHLVWNSKLFFLEIMSKCAQTQQVVAQKSKIFWEEVYALSASATCGYITGNAFTRDSTVMLHIEASVYPSACPSVRPSHSAIVSKQCRLDHETFI